MKIVQIIHNPTAGDAQHSKNGLIEMVEKAGNEYNYVSTDDDDWEKFYLNKMDAILVAGGDGTIRKLAGALLKRMPDTPIPIHLLPLGTANNIAETLGIPPHSMEFPRLDLEGKVERFDCGRIQGLDKEDFFVESVGFGIFPELIAEMSNQKVEEENSADELNRTLEVFIDIVKNFKAQKAKIKFEGISLKGSFLLVELMNIKYLGPNFKAAPDAEPGDSYFDLVLVPEQHRGALVDYLEKIIKGDGEHVGLNKFVKTFRVQKVEMKYKGSTLHVDDSLVKDYSGKSFTLEIIPGVLEFFKP